MHQLLLSVKERYNNIIVKVKGSRNQTKEIFAFTISTCMWCNLGKKWLKERGYGYSYLDIDTITIQERNHLKGKMRELIGEQPRFPLLIVDQKKWSTGYEPSKWEALLNE